MLDALIEEITMNARGDDERLWAFRQAFEDHIAAPSDAFVIANRSRLSNSATTGTSAVG